LQILEKVAATGQLGEVNEVGSLKHSRERENENGECERRRGRETDIAEDGKQRKQRAFTADRFRIAFEKRASCLKELVLQEFHRKIRMEGEFGRDEEMLV
jgi:hypothetical protein